MLGAGANPAFVMDLIRAARCDTRLAGFSVTRALDLRPHRAHRLTRFRLGESPQAFAALPPDQAYGPIGFRQSIDAVADALGWQLRRGRGDRAR